MGCCGARLPREVCAVRAGGSFMFGLDAGFARAGWDPRGSLPAPLPTGFAIQRSWAPSGLPPRPAPLGAAPLRAVALPHPAAPPAPSPGLGWGCRVAGGKVLPTPTPPGRLPLQDRKGFASSTRC